MEFTRPAAEAIEGTGDGRQRGLWHKSFPLDDLIASPGSGFGFDVRQCNRDPIFKKILWLFTFGF